ncbi:Rrf2 family transcriptional regulator [Alkalilimnicola sp. S0819]|uniref:Rrf2 family transcriptional regulator n=1 Tax=Alkalilimnicola sp. S0819 TaxID=2613922 RepID=UPI00126209E5|nr:Rrf2 family transcriptional regulator [Alkalilimnicola sp. S0819]KAB7619503.1 Rrf2 family transcriptional regulator [Alkalilimnicola sp. S0819]MPQ17681.1 Rrf2 family transcriptional regulator [Alkalilimnicola sp. S0819]
MRLSSKGRYAISAMLHLAAHGGAGPVPLVEVSDCQNISLSYVDQIFARLRSAGLVRGTPGPGGGYRLAREAGAISVLEVMSAVDGPRRGKAGQSELEAVIWAELAVELEGYLASITLEGLVDRPSVRQALLQQYRAGGWRCDVCGAFSQRQVACG